MKKETRKAYLVGGGIASLASAVYLIKDGGFDGRDIYIFEEAERVGGSLDGKGSPATGYVARGGRMFSDEVYSCTYNLFSLVPLEEGASKTLLEDFIEFNKGRAIDAKARLVRKGRVVDSRALGLSMGDRANMVRFMLRSEASLGDTKISDHFSHAFFGTNFWILWCTTFAFQPWHSAAEFRRYMLRFLQEFPRMDTMEGVRSTRYNQYDSVVAPITNWLKNNGVHFLMESRVSSLEFAENAGVEQVKRIVYSQRGRKKEAVMGADDLVFLTNGSMTTNSSFGSMASAPITDRKSPRDSWALWRDISRNRPRFGDPSVFDGRIDESKWESFSVTCRDRTFSDLMEDFSGNRPGTGGLTTLGDSHWLLTIAIPPHPHFLNQTEDINVFWGYGLYPDREGNYVRKKMSECTGEEILVEVCSHLGFSKEIPRIVKSSDCVPCMMPYITSQFMPRKKGDRPEVIPKGTRNFAFIGQFCEVPDEVVFTVEQSVRSAMIAVYGLLGVKKEIPPIYQGRYDLAVMGKLFGMGLEWRGFLGR